MNLGHCEFVMDLVNVLHFLYGLRSEFVNIYFLGPL